jgi:hypothetical protein
MNRRSFLFTVSATALLALPASLQAQSKKDDVDLASVPKPVIDVFTEYLAILRTSKDLDECAKRFVAVAGGGLVNEDGKSLRSSVQPFSLKKDFENVKFYANPAQITRVAKLRSKTSGFGDSAITGESYKIWIAKKEGTSGLPAPTTILVPEGHKTIKVPKVIAIGSL